MEYEMQKQINQAYEQGRQKGDREGSISVLMTLLGCTLAVGFLESREINTEAIAQQLTQTVKYEDVNRDGLADIVVQEKNRKTKIYYGTLEGKTTNYLTAEQIKAKSEKQLYSKLEQEIKKYSPK